MITKNDLVRGQHLIDKYGMEIVIISVNSKKITWKWVNDDPDSNVKNESIEDFIENVNVAEIEYRECNWRTIPRFITRLRDNHDS